MYVPGAFRVQDEARLFTAIERWPFGILVDGGAGDGPGATHVPFVADRGGRRLITHLAAANPQCRRLADARALAIFRGPHASVSPHDLGEPARNVPTWNYVAIHVRGIARQLAGDGIIAALDAAVDGHEPSDWHRSQLVAEMRARLERGVCAFALEIEHMTGCWKLSQNKAPAMQRRLHRRLRARGGEARELAGEMTPPGDDPCTR